MAKTAKTKSSFVAWLGFVVQCINICQLIGAIIAFYEVDKEELANEWKYHPEKPIISDIHIDVVFHLRLFTICTDGRLAILDHREGQHGMVGTS